MSENFIFEMDPSISQSSNDLHMPPDLSQFLGDLPLHLDPELVTDLVQGHDEFLDGFDLVKLCDFDADPTTTTAAAAAATTTTTLFGTPAPPCAVKVEALYHNYNAISDEIEPLSPEMIPLQNSTIELEDSALKLTADYLEPTFTTTTTTTSLQQPTFTTTTTTSLQQPTSGLMVQADSMTSLQPAFTGTVVQGDSAGFIQPASCGLMMQGGTEPISQPASLATTIQVNGEPLTQPFSTEIMIEDPSESYIQPGSPRDFLNISSGANQQLALTVISGNSATPAQPIRYIVMGPPSPVDPALPSTIKSETNTINGQDLSVGPKKRGRKRKYPDGQRPRRRGPKKPKVYEMCPLDNPVEEKKRLNAINAKAHRDKVKQERETQAQKVMEVTNKNDQLVKENKALKAHVAKVTIENDQLVKENKAMKAHAIKVTMENDQLLKEMKALKARLQPRYGNKDV